MKQTFKVASWEIKRNLKNKSFLISLFLTPALIALFVFIPTLFEDSDTDSEAVHIFVHDELELLPMIESVVDDYETLDWNISSTDLTHEEVIEQLKDEENSAYFTLDEHIFAENMLT